jgi:hypothetical protein
MSRNACNRLITLAFITLAAIPAAVAMPGFVSDGPNCGVLADAPVRDVWLGHFSGGRWVRDPFGAKVIDWRDDHVCFTSQASCQSWRRRMGAAFGKIGGYQTCVRIR